MKTVYRWWATWVFVAVIVQVGLAGYGAFYTAHKTNDGGVVNQDTFDHGFDPHIVWGYLGVGVSIIVLLLIGVIAGIGKWRLGRHGILFLLFVLQVVLAGAGTDVPAIGFFHPVNALLIFGLAGSIGFTTWRDTRAPTTTSEPSPPEPSTPEPTAAA